MNSLHRKLHLDKFYPGLDSGAGEKVFYFWRTVDNLSDENFTKMNKLFIFLPSFYKKL